jgi:hypothetical protein
MTHMPKNEDVTPAHVCPGMRIQVIDIVQPPGIGIPPVADMDFDQRTVTAVLTMKSNTMTPMNVRPESRSERKCVRSETRDSGEGSREGHDAVLVSNLCRGIQG